MNRHCIPGLTMSTALTGKLLGGSVRIIKTMHTGFSAHVTDGANALQDTEETGRYDEGKIA